MEEQRQLAGIRVLDLSRVVAGPYCTMVLGDLGAEVVKVERPGRGDDLRAWGPPFTPDGESAYFLSVNRNKRSITLNLKHAEGQRIFKQLARDSDVLIENYKPGTLDALGLGYAQLAAEQPRLVYCSITAYGSDGPLRDLIVGGLAGVGAGRPVAGDLAEDQPGIDRSQRILA